MACGPSAFPTDDASARASSPFVEADDWRDACCSLDGTGRDFRDRRCRPRSGQPDVQWTRVRLSSTLSKASTGHRLWREAPPPCAASTYGFYPMPRIRLTLSLDHRIINTMVPNSTVLRTVQTPHHEQRFSADLRAKIPIRFWKARQSPACDHHARSFRS